MFTGGQLTTTQVSKRINDLGNGLLLEGNLHHAFGKLKLGIEPRQEVGQPWRYYIRTFQRVLFVRGGGGDGAEIDFNRQTTHPLPHPELCKLHLAVCGVAHACGAAEVLDDLFYHDPDVLGPVAGSFTLPTMPGSNDFVLPYLERRLFEESLVSDSIDVVL